MAKQVTAGKGEEARLRHPWVVRLLTGLLLLQAAGLLTVAMYHRQSLGLEPSSSLAAVVQAVSSRLLHSTIYTALSILAVMAAIGLWRTWPISWPLAMLVQGLSLTVALIQYFTGRPFYTHLLMLYTVFLVIYFHHPDVQTALQTKKPHRLEEEI